MDRAIFNSKEFLILSLALNNAMTNLFRNGAPGFSIEELDLLKTKVHTLGMAGRSLKPPRTETFTLRDETEIGDEVMEHWKNRL